MTPTFNVRRATPADAKSVEALILRWLSFVPKNGRAESIKIAIRKKEILVAESGSEVVGFIHYALHGDVIDGDLNSFISAFYVSPAHRGLGVGSALLDRAVSDSARRGAVSIETSTAYARAKSFYLRRGFKQFRADIAEVFLELDVQRSEAARTRL